MTSAKVPNVKGVRLGHLNRHPAWPELNVGRLDTPTVMRETWREDEADHAKYLDEDRDDHTCLVIRAEAGYESVLEGYGAQLDGERVEVLRDGGQ
jgi:hypothetical protein